MDSGLQSGPRRLYRSTRDKMVAGVAAGLGDYVGIDPTAVRLLLVVATFISGPVAPLLYLAAWCVVPREDELSPLV